MLSAYLLVSHGSRDPRSQIAMGHLAHLLRQRFPTYHKEVGNPGELAEGQHNRSFPFNRSYRLTGLPVGQPMVGISSLELSPVPLHEQIRQFGVRVKAAGCSRLQVVPLFLLPGVHVTEDIPGEVAQAQQALNQITVDLRPHLGSHPNLQMLLRHQMGTIGGMQQWILLAHGSRLTGSTQPVENMAAALAAIPAYWAIPPYLDSRVQELVSAGHQQIGILPYFLFSGGITDAIAQFVEKIASQFQGANLHLAEPLGASAEVADLILDLIEK